MKEVSQQDSPTVTPDNHTHKRPTILHPLVPVTVEQLQDGKLAESFRPTFTGRNRNGRFPYVDQQRATRVRHRMLGLRIP